MIYTYIYNFIYVFMYKKNSKSIIFMHTYLIICHYIVYIQIVFIGNDRYLIFFNLICEGKYFHSVLVVTDHTMSLFSLEKLYNFITSAWWYSGHKSKFLILFLSLLRVHFARNIFNGTTSCLLLIITVELIFATISCS